jgi:hypothetical protein
MRHTGTSLAEPGVTAPSARGVGFQIHRRPEVAPGGGADGAAMRSRPWDAPGSSVGILMESTGWCSPHPPGNPEAWQRFSQPASLPTA